MNSSVTLKRHGVSEMGLRSLFKISTGFFFGRGITSANFYDQGRRCPLNDALRILHPGKAIWSAYSRRSQLGILSGPTDLERLRFDRTSIQVPPILPVTRGSLFPGQGE